ncbi:hypothetical protein PVAND_003412 [Polypedilum vanderplanki]|uniref:Casein kinase substrate phosphoprotein PP28 domain-containing protein n=1 Tax=Polypedilum vanderplanki TaxID=319348 RepID=A0A9J6BUF0_POLVA|nr:hypothetical protein PVAND_003412 [Polypedilum vanderplanki]
MPRGKYVNHKGRNRHFTSPEELEQERKAEEMKKWRKKKANEDESEEEESGSEQGESGSEEDESDSDDDQKRKGVQDLIEIENPNRAPKKQNQKLKTLDAEGSAAGSSTSSKQQAPAELSRREREELERQQKQANYQKLHAQGKTEQARADLARLAIIRQQREEAAKLREQKRKETEEAKKK